MGQYSVRRAKLSDIPGVLRLLEQVDMVHHKIRPDLFKGPATKYNDEQLADIFGNEATPVFVCVDGNDAVKGHAFCILRQALDDNVMTDILTLYIDDICVDEETRRQNIGKMLYDRVIEYARSLNCYNVTLNVWEGNDGAKQFYEKNGFKVQKTGMEIIL